MGDQVRGLEVVLGDGRVVRTKPLPRASVGPDLTQLFIGAEGTLGIITEITIQVFRAPEAVWRRAYQFRSFEDGFRTIEEIWATGLRPSLLEFGDRFAVPGTHWGRAEPPTLFIGFEGFSEEVDACARRTAKICGTALDLGTAAVEAFWRDRHQAAVRFAIARNEQVVDQPAGLPPSARLDYLHVTLPSSQVVPFRARAMQTFANAGALVTETGIWTRPELFSMVVVQLAPDGAGVPPLADTVDAVLKLAQDAGGAMEYCHGVGAALTHLIEREHGAAGLGVLRQVKQACDPFDVLNPGKLGLDGDRRSQGQR
jgi:FAD/FMN-containing dehydrogenase